MYKNEKPISHNFLWASKIMRNSSAPPEIQKQRWLQTERKTHEAWGRFTISKPAASAVMHTLCAMVGEGNAVVVSQAILAKALGITDRTVRTAIKALEEGNWLQVVRIGKGKESVYVINDRVVWGEKRSNLRLSRFSATVIADYEDQDAGSLTNAPLYQLPAMFGDEAQLPTGPGEDPPSQPSLTGLEPDLPSTKKQKNRVNSI